MAVWAKSGFVIYWKEFQALFFYLEWSSILYTKRLANGKNMYNFSESFAALTQEDSIALEANINFYCNFFYNLLKVTTSLFT